MKKYLCFSVCILLLQFSLPVYSYGLSFALENKQFNRFAIPVYGYSSLFRQGRDDVHMLDILFSDQGYLISNEEGRAGYLGSVYRYMHRLRWARYFKPTVIVEAGIVQLSKTDRRRINAQNIYAGSLPNAVSTDYDIALGAGYFWEIRSVLLATGLKYGYNAVFGEEYVSPFFILSVSIP